MDYYDLQRQVQEREPQVLREEDLSYAFPLNLKQKLTQNGSYLDKSWRKYTMEDVRFESKVIHPEVQPVTREAIAESLNSARKTREYYTKYEYTTLVGIRAQQIAEGARPLVSLEGIVTSSPRFVWDVAEREITEKKLPFIIHRQFPNGESEYWSATELSILW